MQLKPKTTPVVAKAGAELIDENRLFIECYKEVVNGLLASNTYYSEDGLCWQEMLSEEQLLEKAENLAEMMTEAVKDRLEVRKFENKLH